MRGGTVLDVPTRFLPSHSRLGWDGQWDTGMEGLQLYVPTHSLPSLVG